MNAPAMGAYTFRPAIREQTSLLIGVAGPSGSGKTASALKLARGILDGQDEGIFVIDTEANRASHYACAPGEKNGPFSFRFQHCDMKPPFSSDAYREVIGAAVGAGAKVIIVDSMSHEHEGQGGMLEAQAAELARMGGQESKKFAAWIKPKADHNKLVNFILQQRCHFIFAFRAKDKMKLLKVEKNGRSTVEPVQLGWTAICSDRFEYEMTTMLMLPPTARGVPDLTLESTKINAHHVDFFPVGEPITEECGRKLADWARAVRRPSDLGFDDAAFVLPPLTVVDHTVKARTQRDGWLFDLPAIGLHEEREERRRTVAERCEMVAGLVDHGQPALAWCHLNEEAAALVRMIPDAEQVSGADDDDTKEAKLLAFARGDLRVLVTKPKIGAWGLNLQHCAHVTLFPSHSYEQYYQGIRRCWRFGQKRPVRVDRVATDGEAAVLANLTRKALAADQMFTSLVGHMNQALRIDSAHLFSSTEVIPAWLSASS